MGKLILKVLALAVCLILCLLSGLMDVGLRLYSFGAGLVYLFLFVCLLLAVVSKQWMNVGIIAGILSGAVLVTVLFGIVGAIVEVWKDRIRVFLQNV